MAVLVGPVAAPASAEPTRVDRVGTDRITGPRLAGPSLFYAENGSRRVVLRLASPDAEARKLISLSPPPLPPSPDDESPGDFVSSSFEIGASADRLAYKTVAVSGNARYQVGQSRLTLFAGATSGEFARSLECGHNDIYSPAASALDIDGPRVAFSDCTGRVVIRDHSAATETIVSAGEGLAIGTAKIAGRYLAYNAHPIGPTGTSPTVTVVHDWVANTKLYEIPRVASFDVQDDGTLAVSTGQVDDLDCSDGKLAWYSAAQPTEHVLPLKPCTADVRIAGGRIMAIATGDSADEHVLALVGLDGARTNVARLGPLSLRRGSPDYDGTRVAYALGNCIGGADLMTESATSPVLQTNRVTCPVGGLPSKGKLGPKDRYAPVSVKCSRGCRGRIAITARVNGKMRTIGTRTVRIHPEDPCLTKRHDVPIASSARSALRSRGSLLGRVTVSTPDRTGTPRVTSRAFRLSASSRNRGGAPGDCDV